MKPQNNLLRYLLGGVVLLVILAIIGKQAGWIGGKSEISVAVDSVTRKTIIETVSASGKVQPEVIVKLSPEVSGEIISIHVQEGDRVKKGQLLCRIRPDFYASDYTRSQATVNQYKANLANSEAQLASAQASFANASSTYERNQKLHAEKVISNSEFDAVTSQYEQAKQAVAGAKQGVQAAKYNVASTQAQLQQSGVTLSKTTIYSPIDGIVSLLSVKEGERVLGTSQMQGTEVMRIADLRTMEAQVDVNENDINRISLNDSATVEVDAFLGRKFNGYVTAIANSATAGTGTGTDQVTNFQVKIRLLPVPDLAKEGFDSPFRPGLSANVDIHTNTVNDALSIPIQAVTTREGDKKFVDPGMAAHDNGAASQRTTDKAQVHVVQSIVFVLKDGLAKATPVNTGIQDDNFIEIKSGLKPGEYIITAPYTALAKTLKDGDNVKRVAKEKLFSEDKK